MPSAWSLQLPGGVAVVLGALALVCGLGSSASPQTRCAREGDWLVCEDGERYFINLDPYTRSRAGSSRGGSGNPGEGARDAWMTDGNLLYSSDGLVCWRHGSHVHCQ